MTITIMGASGRVGGTVLETVAQAGRQVRALCRNPPADAARDGVEWRAVDALDSAALTAAFAGSTAVFVMNPVAPDAENVDEQAGQLSASVAGALRAAEVPYAVALSSQGAHLPIGTAGIVGTLHGFETALRGAMIKMAILRPAYFMESWVPMAMIAAESGQMPALLAPLDRAVETVSARDVGAAAGRLLLSPQPGIYEITGPQRYSESDAAGILSRHLGRQITAKPLPGEEVAEFHRQAGFGASFSAGIAAMYAALNGDGIPFAGQGTQRLRGERRLETVLTDAT
ncbi:NmrA family NAD(P)-binding protein [Paracoccus sp. (in: a-proteobacteria)]|uniref:NmrA family NAD(P)-binding protein n=1 Tax=Paracoccus sp. TaxID=267 RepID=UPI0035AF67A2